jgi:hypothetical protein
MRVAQESLEPCDICTELAKSETMPLELVESDALACHQYEIHRDPEGLPRPRCDRWVFLGEQMYSLLSHPQSPVHRQSLTSLENEASKKGFSICHFWTDETGRKYQEA